MSDFRLRAEERLKSRKEIEQLFGGGSHSLGQYPFRLVWRPALERRGDFPVQVAITVSKRNFKHAVDRNRIKRLLREAYRQNKQVLYQGLGEEKEQLAWMIIYIGREMPASRKVNKAMLKLMHKFLRARPQSATNA